MKLVTQIAIAWQLAVTAAAVTQVSSYRTIGTQADHSVEIRLPRFVLQQQGIWRISRPDVL